MREAFALVPVHRLTWWGLAVLWLVLMLIAYLAPHQSQSITNPLSWWWWVIPFATALPLVGIWAMLLHRHIQIKEGNLAVAGGLLFKCKVAITELVLDKARVLDLDEHTEFKPMLSLGSVTLPGFSAGQFLLRNRSRAFCLLTHRSQVLVVPRRNGKLILLSPEKPQVLLSRLHEVAGQRLPNPKLARETARR